MSLQMALFRSFLWLSGVGRDWATSLWLFTFMHWKRKWQPTPVFLPGESQGLGSLVGCHLWGRTESDRTEATWQQQQQHSAVCMYIPRILYPFICWQNCILGCFHVLAIVNSAAVNIRVHVSSENICPGVGLLEHMETPLLFLFFEEPPLLFSIVTAPTYFLTNSVGGFPFLYTLSSSCYLEAF